MLRVVVTLSVVISGVQVYTGFIHRDDDVRVGVTRGAVTDGNFVVRVRLCCVSYAHEGERGKCQDSDHHCNK